MRSLFVLFLAFALACDGGDDTSDAGADATPDAAAADGAMTPTAMAPEAPALPDLSPCFEGFREVVDGDGVTVCEPWPESGRASCADGEAHFVGRPGCERIGTACPSGGFAEGLPADGVYYVSPSATGGDGSLASPFGTIDEALAAAADGDTIALGVGTFRGEVALDRPMHLIGACPTGTILTSDAQSATAGVVTIRGPGAALRNLQIASSARSAIWVAGATATASVEDVIIEGVTMIGIDVELGATVDVTHASIANVALSDVAPFTGYVGRGINVESGSTLTLDTVDIEDVHEFGLLSYHDDTTITATRLSVSGVGPTADGGKGVGLMALDGGSVEANGIAVMSTRDFAAAAGGVGSRIAIEDAWIEGAQPSMSGGRGLNVQDGASGSCHRCRIVDSLEAGVLVGAASTAELSDLVVGITSGGMSKRGLEAQSGANVTVSRVLVVDGRETGLLVDGEGTVLTMSDVTIMRIAPVGEGILGRAVSVQDNASLVVSRGLFRDLTDNGIYASLGASMELSDITIRHVSPWASGQFGRGISVQNTSTLRGARIDIEDVHDIGMFVLNDSGIELTDLRVVGTQPATCDCPSQQGGHGLGIYGSTASIDNVDLEDHALCGIHVANDGDAMLRMGRVVHNEIGACIQSDAQTLDTLQDDVFYVDNGVNLQATMLPVPAASDDL